MDRAQIWNGIKKRWLVWIAFAGLLFAGLIWGWILSSTNPVQGDQSVQIVGKLPEHLTDADLRAAREALGQLDTWQPPTTNEEKDSTNNAARLLSN